MKYDFDILADRRLDSARKWDIDIIRIKYPEVREDFIPLWIADMDFKAAPEVREALSKVSENGAFGYTFPTERWYQSVINWQKIRHGNNVKHEWLTLGYGTVPNLHIAVQAFTDVNDSILITTPVYGPFAYAAEHNDRKVLKVPLLIKNNRYEINWETLESTMKNKHPKLMIFCNPHNPSGRIWSEEEIIKVAKLCKENNVIMISDEVHSEHIMKGTFISSLQLPEEYLDNLIMFTSPNKGFNFGGLKLSYSIIPNKVIREIFKKQYLRNSVTSPNVPGQVAMITAYEEGYDWLIQCEEYLRENLQIFQKKIREDFPEWKMMEMDSSYLPWVNVSESGMTMDQIAELMANKAGVIIATGDDFVADSEGFLRFNLGTSRQVLEEALERMSTVWKEYRN